jgi:alpha-1,2-mannosyltransferase
VRTVLTLVATAAIAAAIGFKTTQLNLFSRTDRPTMLAVLAAAWLFFALAFLALRRVPTRHVTAVVLAGAVLIGGAAMLGPPNTSTDSARYAWDGIVATAGISPYDHVPASDALEDLRPDWLFPSDCDATRISETTSVPSGEPLCTAINRPHVPTIYPPFAELYFTGVRALVDPSVQYWPFQLGGLIVSLAVTWMLLLALRRRDIDPRWAALWAWCPLVATEAVTNSHVDVLGVALALAASLLVASGRRIWGAIAMGAAVATKLIPVILAPPLLKKRPLTVIGVSIVTFALLYVPYVVMSGFGVLGYLPGYLSEEGYDDGSRFALLSIALPGSAAIVVAAVLIAVATGLAWWKSDAAAPWLAQLALVGSILIIVSPRYPWYALLMIPFIVLSQRWEWFVVPLALSLRMMVPTMAMTRTALAVAAVVVICGWLYRRRRAGLVASGITAAVPS